jgi:hypothetical protein
MRQLCVFSALAAIVLLRFDAASSIPILQGCAENFKQVRQRITVSAMQEKSNNTFQRYNVN